MSVKLYKDGKLIPISGPLYSSGNFPGQVVMGANINAPAGWLLCDGTAYNKVEYQDLFAAIGTQYNAPDTPEGQFCVPDMRGRYALGASATEPVGEKIAEQLPNIKGDSIVTGRSGTGRKTTGCVIDAYSTSDVSATSTPNAFSFSIDASRTTDREGNTIDNPAYKDPVGGVPVKVRPDSMTLNYYIKY